MAKESRNALPSPHRGRRCLRVVPAPDPFLSPPHLPGKPLEVPSAAPRGGGCEPRGGLEERRTQAGHLRRRPRGGVCAHVPASTARGVPGETCDSVPTVEQGMFAAAFFTVAPPPDGGYPARGEPSGRSLRTQASPPAWGRDPDAKEKSGAPGARPSVTPRPRCSSPRGCPKHATTCVHTQMCTAALFRRRESPTSAT